MTPKLESLQKRLKQIKRDQVSAGDYRDWDRCERLDQEAEEVTKAIQAELENPTPMTKQQIIAKRAELLGKIKDLNKQIEHVRLDLQHLQLDCSHPAAYSYRDRSGEGCTTCPDCGYDR